MSDERKAWLNGKLIPWDQATVTRRLTEITGNVLNGSDDRFNAWFEPVG